MCFIKIAKNPKDFYFFLCLLPFCSATPPKNPSQLRPTIPNKQKEQKPPPTQNLHRNPTICNRLRLMQLQTRSHNQPQTRTTTACLLQPRRPAAFVHIRHHQNHRPTIVINNPKSHASPINIEATLQLHPCSTEKHLSQH